MFQFKRFTVLQERSAMKVGTDGVLLGAWTSVDQQPYSILDIGAGTGIISLMLAQRSNAEQIDAVEIDEDAYEECVENFENSPWSDRLFCYHTSFAELISEPEDKYDLIISNPPFHSEDYFSGDEKRDAARFTNSLPFEELLSGVATLLSQNGIFSTIIPFSAEDKFVEIAKSNSLFPYKILRVRGNPDSELKRSLISFSRNNFEIEIGELIIENSRHNYTAEYIELTKDFYLKM